MATLGKGCLGVEEVERIAAGETVAPEVAAHAVSCASCGARIDEARQNATFIERARSLTPIPVAPR